MNSLTWAICVNKVSGSCSEFYYVQLIHTRFIKIFKSFKIYLITPSGIACPLHFHVLNEIISVIEFHWAIFRSNIWLQFRIISTIEIWLQKFSSIFFHQIAKAWFDGIIWKFYVFNWFKNFTYFLLGGFHFTELCSEYWC